MSNITGDPASRGATRPSLASIPIASRSGPCRASSCATRSAFIAARLPITTRPAPQPSSSAMAASVPTLGVRGPAVHQELVMQVRPGRESRGSDEADRLALGHLLARAQPAGEARQVTVAGADAVGMAQLDQVAVPAVFASHARDD